MNSNLQSSLTSWPVGMKLKLYFLALRTTDQAFGNLSRKHGRIDLPDHFPFRREQVRIGGMSDFHPMEILSANLPVTERRTGCVQSGFRSGDDSDLWRGECCCRGRRRVPDLIGLTGGSVTFSCRDQDVLGYVAA